MKRSHFIKLAALAPLTLSSMNLHEFEKITSNLTNQGKKTPVLFTSHGNPMEIVVPREQSPFWTSLNKLGKELTEKYDVKAALVVSAHWCTRGTYVNISQEQKQIYDYYGFPEHYYDPKYNAHGAPDVAKEIQQYIPNAQETSDWGLDHGAWPMLMHLFPEANIPVFQMSISYYETPEYHYQLGKQLKALREKGVLIIGSGALIHNLPLASKKMIQNDMKAYGWEAEYDMWIKQQLDQRNFKAILEYETSHKLGKLAAPTPDHFVPVLYSLGLMDPAENIQYFYDGATKLPAFSERSFVIS